MFKVKPKFWNEARLNDRLVLTVYKVESDSNGYPKFLLYIDEQWIWKSAKHFEPID